jgi:predicted nucleotidyltransferase
MHKIKEIINDSGYDFLRTDEHLKENLMFLVFGGSHAYGTSMPESDIDIRGCAFNSRSDLIGMSSFEQVVEPSTDTTVYSFNKLIKLICDCNPNTIEMLGCKPEHYLIVSPIAQELIDNQKLFLSKKAADSFGGYANQQLRRLQNALARDSYPQAEKERHIMTSIKSAMLSFEDRYQKLPEGSMTLTIDKSDKEEFDSEIFIDVNLRHYPLRDFRAVLADMQNIIKDYDKLSRRNKKKDDIHLNKHAMHLVRLYLMCLDILEKEEINTYRGDDLELLMSIRNGKYQKKDSTFYMEFFDMVTDYENRLNYAIDNTNLPDKPDYALIEDFVMSVNGRVISK